MAFNPQDHMMDLKGKQYLQVMWRLVWFREEHPDWTIRTEMMQCSDTSAIFRAEVRNDEDRVLSTGYGSESVKDFKDFLEKAETKSVGRALAMLGYGTQFAPELDEEERIVDSPVPKKKAEAKVIDHPTAADVQKLAAEAAEKLTPVKMVTDAQVANIQTLARERNVLAQQIYQRYKIKSIKELTYDQANSCIKDLMKTKA